MSDGSGEWRQLQMDMQEIIDWLSRAEQELKSQQPCANDTQTVRKQHDNHQVGVLLSHKVPHLYTHFYTYESTSASQNSLRI